jgi:hypothetical protein
VWGVLAAEGDFRELLPSSCSLSERYSTMKVLRYCGFVWRSCLETKALEDELKNLTLETAYLNRSIMLRGLAFDSTGDCFWLMIWSEKPLNLSPKFLRWMTAPEKLTVYWLAAMLT